jgi:hypothetical protein
MMSNLSRTSFVATSILIPNSNSNVITEIFSLDCEEICFKSLTVFNYIFQRFRHVRFNVGSTGSRIGSHHKNGIRLNIRQQVDRKPRKEKIPNMTIATNINAVDTGLRTAVEYKLIFFYFTTSTSFPFTKRLCPETTT